MKTQEEIQSNNQLQKALFKATSVADLVLISKETTDVVIVGIFSNDGKKLKSVNAVNSQSRANFLIGNKNGTCFLNGEVL